MELTASMMEGRVVDASEVRRGTQPACRAKVWHRNAVLEFPGEPPRILSPQTWAKQFGIEVDR